MLSGCRDESAVSRTEILTSAHPIDVILPSYRTNICVRLCKTVALYSAPLSALIALYNAMQTHKPALGHRVLTSLASCLLGGAPP